MRPGRTEQCLISTILRGGDPGVVMRHGITSEMFVRYPQEFAYIERQHARTRKPIEKVAFKQAFPEFQVLKCDDPEVYIERLRDEYARDALARLMGEVTEHLSAGHAPTSILGEVEKKVRRIAVTAAAEPSVNILEDWSGTWEAVRGRSERKEAHGYTGIPTGLRTLDQHTGGVQPGELWICGARLGQGKTWFLVKLATEALRAQYGVHVESLEQPRNQIAMRLHTFLSDGNYRHGDLAGGMVDLDEYKAFLSGLAGNHVGGALHITDATRGRATVQSIAAHVERHRPDIVLVDYLTLIRSPGGKDWQAMADLSADLKAVATTYDVGIVAAAQLNREMGMRALPGPEALAQSDSFGQDADVVITMRRNRDCDAVMDLLLSKNRHGNDGLAFSAEFRPNEGKFTEISDARKQELIDAMNDAP